MRTLKRTNPKGHDVQVSDDGCQYGNGAFALNFQKGEIPQYGVRNGAFEEEILAVLVDRAKQSGNTALEAKLTEAMAILVPADTVPQE